MLSLSRTSMQYFMCCLISSSEITFAAAFSDAVENKRIEGLIMKDNLEGAINELLKVGVELADGFRSSMKFLEVIAEETLI